MVVEQFVNMLSASNEWTPLTMIKGGDDRDDEEQQIRSLNNNNNNNSSNSKMMLGTKGDEGRRKVMEKASQEQMEKAPLKCPRCDSTNTKFCYYNNYSLSQPRHFCKACKRYWTRGGTLRTVPVGGGCRKNKRVIRRVVNPNLSSPNPTSSSTACNNNNNNSPSNTTTTTTHQSLNPSSSGSHLMSPLLYGLPTNLTSAFPFSSSYDNNNHHQFNGLGFSSAGMILGQRNGYSTNSTTPKQILHDLISNSNPFHGSNPNTTSTATLHHHQHQHKFSFETLFPYDLDLQIKGVGSYENEGDVYIKDDSTVKLECQVQNGYHHQQQQQEDMEEPDPAILWNANSNGNSTIGVNWLDPNYSNQLGLI